MLGLGIPRNLKTILFKDCPNVLADSILLAELKQEAAKMGIEIVTN